MKYAARLAQLEQRAASADAPIIIVRRTRAKDGSPLIARIVTHDGAPSPDAIAARAELEAEGFTVAEGWGAR
jgi:hypothetical protein